MKPSKELVRVKLKRQLYDLFQSSRVNCNGWCCGWDAFNLSDHWIGRWCEFRDERELHAVNVELQKVKVLTAHVAEEMPIEIVEFLRTDAAQFRRRIGDIEKVVRMFDSASR